MRCLATVLLTCGLVMLILNTTSPVLCDIALVCAYIVNTC